MYRLYSVVFSALSVCSFFAGIASFVYFLFFASNVNAAAWCFLTGFLSAVDDLSQIGSPLLENRYFNAISSPLCQKHKAVLSVCALHIFILHLRRTLFDWYTMGHLRGIISFGLIVFLLSDVALAIYLSLAVINHQNYTLQNVSYYVAATSTAATSFWSFILFLSGLLFRRYRIQNPPLLTNYRSYS